MLEWCLLVNGDDDDDDEELDEELVLVVSVFLFTSFDLTRVAK